MLQLFSTTLALPHKASNQMAKVGALKKVSEQEQ